MNNEQYLVVVSGPSGSGKDTVVSRLMAQHPEIEISVSATTRDKRPGEQEGVNYYYLTVPAFEQKIADGEILEEGTPDHFFENPQHERVKQFLGKILK